MLSGVQLYLRYTLGLPAAHAFFLQGVVVLVAAGGLFLWLRLITRIGAVRTWRIALLVLAGSFVPMYFAGSLPAALGAGALLGLAWAGMMATNDLVVARVLEAELLRDPHRRAALRTVRIELVEEW